METLLVGIDLGTSSVKAECYNTSFHTLCRLAEPLSLKTWHENGRVYAEQDLGEVLQATLSVLSRAIREAKSRKADKVHIGLSGQAPGLVLLDRQGNPLHRYISWMDRRAEKEAIELGDALGGWETVRKITGLRPDPLFTGAKLMWFARNHPEILEKAWKAMQLKDAVFTHLTGMAWTDPTHASETLMYNLPKNRWEPEILNAIGIDEGMLPEVRETTEGVSLRKELQNKLGAGGLEIKVFLGCVDSVCSHLVAESGKENTLVDTTGTSTCLNFTLHEPDPDPWGAFEVYRHAIPGRYVGEASLPTGGRGLEYFLRLTGMDWREVAELGPSPVDLIVLPFLEGTRSPDWNPQLRGLVYGVSLSTTREDIVKAYMQGVALWMRGAMGLLREWRGGEYSLLRTVGGGSRLHVWNRIKAGVLGLRVEKYAWVEASSLGAAVIARVGGGGESWERVLSLVDRSEASYMPEEAWSEWVSKWEPLFRELWRTVSGVRRSYAFL